MNIAVRAQSPDFVIAPRTKIHTAYGIPAAFKMPGTNLLNVGADHLGLG